MTRPIACSCLDDDACWRMSDELHESLRVVGADADIVAGVVWTTRELLRNSERYGGGGGVAEVRIENATQVVLRLPGPPFDSRAAAAEAAAKAGDEEENRKALGIAHSILEVAAVEWEYGWVEENQITFSWRPRNA